MINKTILRIPTNEQYAFVEMEVEGLDADGIVSFYNDMTARVKGGMGMIEKDWNRVLDNYLWGTATMTADEYETMNLAQQQIIQCVKRSRKRHQAK